MFNFSAAKSQQFVNIANITGLIASCDGEFGNGVSYYDWDFDGYDDIVLLGDSVPVRFFKNNSGLFSEIEMSGIDIQGFARSVNWVDINNDGRPDLSFNVSLGTFKLFLNTGNFNFIDISASSGIEQVNSQGYGQSWADYDKDGFIDVYICNYQNNQFAPPRTNYLYKNNGDGTFTNTTNIANVSNGVQLTFLSIWMDYDNDSWLDLFVFNDRPAHSNSLYRNNGDGTFTDESVNSGFGEIYDPMSGSVSDFNNDGYFDIYSTNILGNKLYQNNGQGTFSNVAAAYNAQMFLMSWGAVWIDINGDSKEDLIVSVQDVTSMYNSLYYLQLNESSFETVQTTGLGNSYGNPYSLAMGDYNNDGKAEILSHGRLPYGSQLWRIVDTDYHYLKVRLNGTISNRDGIGATIELYIANEVQRRFTLSGEQYLSQNSQWKFFSLGDSLTADSLIVRWPSGIIDKLIDISSDQALVINEGDFLDLNVISIGNEHPCQGDTVILDAGNWDSYVWNDGSIDRYLTVSEEGEYYVSVESNGLSVNSETIFIDFILRRDFLILADSIDCYGGNSVLTITDLNGTQINTIYWNNSNTSSSSYTALAYEQISFSCTDENNCYLAGIVSFGEPSELNVLQEINYNVVLNCPDTWSGQATADGGMAPYSFNWEFIDLLDSSILHSINDSNFDCINYQNVLLKCTVQDANECSILQTQILNPLSSKFIEPSNKLIVYPTLVTDYLYFNGLKSNSIINIYNITGQLVKSVSINENVNFIDVTSLSNATFIIEFRFINDFSQTSYFIKRD